MAVDPVVVAVDLFRKKYNISPEEFAVLDKKHAVMDFIYDGSEEFSRTGNEKFLEEIWEYVERQRGTCT